MALTAASLNIRYAHLQLPYSAPVSFSDLGSCLAVAGQTPMLVARLGYSDLASHALRRSLSQMLE